MRKEERGCQAQGTASVKTQRWGREGGLGEQSVCPSGRGMGSFREPAPVVSGKGAWSVPQRNARTHTVPLVPPQASCPSPSP